MNRRPLMRPTSTRRSSWLAWTASSARSGRVRSSPRSRAKWLSVPVGTTTRGKSHSTATPATAATDPSPPATASDSAPPSSTAAKAASLVLPPLQHVHHDPALASSSGQTLPEGRRAAGCWVDDQVGGGAQDAAPFRFSYSTVGSLGAFEE